MSALVVMLLLGFLLIIAVSLTLWAALTLNDNVAVAVVRSERGTRSRGATPATPQPTPRRPSNDEVRGARARVTRRETATDDAFERFVRTDARHDESEF